MKNEEKEERHQHYRPECQRLTRRTVNRVNSQLQPSDRSPAGRVKVTKGILESKSFIRKWKGLQRDKSSTGPRDTGCINGAYPSIGMGKGKQTEGLRLSDPGSDPVCRPSLSSPGKIAKSVEGL